MWRIAAWLVDSGGWPSYWERGIHSPRILPGAPVSRPARMVPRSWPYQRGPRGTAVLLRKRLRLPSGSLARKAIDEPRHERKLAKGRQGYSSSAPFVRFVVSFLRDHGIFRSVLKLRAPGETAPMPRRRWTIHAGLKTGAPGGNPDHAGGMNSALPESITPA